MVLYEYSAKFYMSLYNSLLPFIYTYVGFVLSMFTMIFGLSPYLFICRWEAMGTTSTWLVRNHGRRLLSLFSGSMAWLMNRVGDLAMFVSFMVSLFLGLILAWTCKSSLLVFSSWLGHAMERPTTVSSLLHSSTMVLARLLLILGVDVVLILYVGCLALVGFLVAFYRRSNGDYKRTMANSTSSQLNFIGVISICISSVSAIFYMLNHAGFKAGFFMLVGIVMHFTRAIKSSVGLRVNKMLLAVALSFISFMARLFRFSVACMPKDLLFLSCTDILTAVLLGVALGSYVYGKVLVASGDRPLSLHSGLGIGLAACVSMARGFRRAELFLGKLINKILYIHIPRWVIPILMMSLWVLLFTLMFNSGTGGCPEAIIVP